MQRAAVNPSPVNAVPPIVHEVLRSPGQPLDAATRAFMEPRFGHDFSTVRVHTGNRAAESARAVNALAYTVGDNIVFGVGQFAPHTSSGKRLMAHELTHVLQQSHDGVSTLDGSTRVSEPSSADEREAEVIARQVISTGSDETVTATIHPATSTVQRLGDLKKVPLGLERWCNIANDPPASPVESLLFANAVSTLSALQRAQIDNFVINWRAAGANVPVRVDGYASTSGSDELNWKLSCDRAEAVAAELTMPSSGIPGIPAGFVRKVAQGETTEFGAEAQNRRATISSLLTLPPTPPPPKPTPTPPVPTPACSPKPIDITKIPNVMDAKGWLHGAALLREWFNNPDSGGPPDTSTITIDWVLGFAKPKEVYESILNNKIYVNTAAQSEIAKLLKRLGKDKGGVFDFAIPVTKLDPNPTNPRDPSSYYINHRAIQTAGLLSNLDDLSAALGNFDMRIVVGGRVDQEAGTTPPRFKATITDVGVYVPDSFDFTGDQDLGCWNVCTNEVGKYFCGGGENVSNKDFRDWRAKNKKGGDFLVYTDVKATKLKQPDSFFLP